MAFNRSGYAGDKNKGSGGNFEFNAEARAGREQAWTMHRAYAEE